MYGSAEAAKLKKIMEDDYTKLQMQVADLQLENKDLFNNKEMSVLMKDRVESADKEIE